MRSFTIVFMTFLSFASFASELKPKDIKVGTAATYYHFGLMERMLGKVAEVYSDNKVLICSDSNNGFRGCETENIENVGIQISENCKYDICNGDFVRYHLPGNGDVSGKVTAIFDNGFVKVVRNGSYSLKRISKVNKVLNN